MCAVVFDDSVFLREVEEVIGDVPFGLVIRQGNQDVYNTGEIAGPAFTVDLSAFPDVQIQLYLPGQSLLADVVNRISVPMVCAILLAATFLGMAFFFSNKYYAPISQIGDMVAPPQQRNADTDSLVTGVRTLLGERDTYRKRIDFISPYADQRILRDFLLGNTGKESLHNPCACRRWPRTDGTALLPSTSPGPKDRLPGSGSLCCNKSLPRSVPLSTPRNCAFGGM